MTTPILIKRDGSTRQSGGAIRAPLEAEGRAASGAGPSMRVSVSVNQSEAGLSGPVLERQQVEQPDAFRTILDSIRDQQDMCPLSALKLYYDQRGQPHDDSQVCRTAGHNLRTSLLSQDSLEASLLP